jgi:uncharacterized protein YbbC (DUF1343 family)
MRTRRSMLAGLAAAAGAAGTARTLTGVDVLQAEGFARVARLRVGLITNQTGRDGAGRRTIDVLRGAPGVRLAALFSPEHGLDGRREGRIGSGVDAASGLPVTSLYGASRRPDPATLAGLDALVVDLQDVGVRFFTYATTMAYALEAAAPAGLKVFVLDRPNPIAPAGVKGPVLDPALRSFTGYFPTPLQHAMTLGELAGMFNAENRIGARLEVVAMRGWRREMWLDQTGLPWIDPSPNLRSLAEAILYPGVGLIEGANVSVGRGTANPFERVGAPWIRGEALAADLDGRGLAGVRFAAAAFTPAAAPYAGRRCEGVRILLADRTRLDAPRLGLELACALQRQDPARFAVRGLLGNLGSEASVAAIAAGEDAAAIAAGWRAGLEAFAPVRQRHLLYA